MALNFPLSPISGQTYSINGKDWIFNGFAWDAVNSNSSHLVILIFYLLYIRLNLTI